MMNIFCIYIHPHNPISDNRVTDPKESAYTRFYFYRISQQAHDIKTTSYQRRCDVVFRLHTTIRFSIDDNVSILTPCSKTIHTTFTKLASFKTSSLSDSFNE